MYRKPFFHTSLISPFNSYEGFLVASVLSILFAFIGFSFIIVLCLVPKVACFPVLSIINCPLFFSLWFSLTSITMCEEHTDVRLFEVSVFERKVFFYLEIKEKLTGLSNQFEPSMVFDPSEFEAPKFDCTVKSPLFVVYKFLWFSWVD